MQHAWQPAAFELINANNTSLLNILLVAVTVTVVAVVGAVDAVIVGVDNVTDVQASWL